jgi:SAM-dependent methyltransferase
LPRHFLPSPFSTSPLPPIRAKYKQHYDALWERIRHSETALQQAVGGEFEVVGYLEFARLRQLGLKPEHAVIGVGCGSGRLAVQLAPWLDGRYLGTDILPSLLDHARKLCGRDDWTFVETNGQEIPAPDESADFVTYFSVLTHINHEESYRYLAESKRVLRPGVVIVCSFLEFLIRSHWAIFRADLQDRSPEKVLNQFLSRDAFQAFAFNLGLELVSFIDGDKPTIPIDRELNWSNGVQMSGLGNLGQSVCVLRKPLVPLPLPL